MEDCYQCAKGGSYNIDSESNASVNIQGHDSEIGNSDAYEHIVQGNDSSQVTIEYGKEDSNATLVYGRHVANPEEEDNLAAKFEEEVKDKEPDNSSFSFETKQEDQHLEDLFQEDNYDNRSHAIFD